MMVPVAVTGEYKFRSKTLSSRIGKPFSTKGMTVEEAISMIDMQIHNGILAKQGSFTIIHGKGTGALRKGIHDYLKRCSHVSEYRLGTFGEGDTGVTIVTLS
ncbi:MAG: Smr/MutS family protein, partial [Clostridia bacterium]|nr:Smr/MutS family protein [Clostridia bacterium]